MSLHIIYLWEARWPHGKRLTRERTIRVRAPAGDIVLCSWARHFTLTVPPSTQVYKWVPANLMLGVTLRWTGIPSKTGISSGLMGHLARMQTLPTYIPA